MSIKDKLQQDLKSSMIARDTARTDVIKGIKSAILYAEVAAGKRESGGLSDEEILGVLKKESKKRQESADLYDQGGNTEMAAKERAEKSIIDSYLPPQMSEEALLELINATLTDMGLHTPTKQDMGKIIGAVKARGGAEIDGAMLAKLVSQRIAA